MKSKKVVRSHFVAAGPLGHELSPLSRLGYGISEASVDEITLSSTWLWQLKSAGQIKPRFSVGFPGEWEELKTDLNVSSHLRIDLWIFKKLSQSELLNLMALMELHENFRVVLAVNHLLNWQELAATEVFLNWARQERALISFLPSKQELDPFLKPQEVLVALERIGDSFPVLITEFQSDVERFYQTLQREDHPLLARQKLPLFTRFFKALEFWGFGHFVLALESLIGLLLEGRWNRLMEFFSRIFTVPAFAAKALRSLDWIYHKALRPLWTLLRYGVIERIFISPLNHSWIFLRHRLFPLLKKWIWHRGFFKAGILIRYRIIPFLRHRLWPALGQWIWYKSLFQLWIFVRYKSIPTLLVLAFPFRKLYWMAEYQYQKRIQKRIRG